MYHNNNNNKYKITSSTLRNYCSPEVLKKYERTIYDVCSDSPFERVYPPGIRPPIECSIDSSRIVNQRADVFNR